MILKQAEQIQRKTGNNERKDKNTYDIHRTEKFFSNITGIHSPWFSQGHLYSCAVLSSKNRYKNCFLLPRRKPFSSTAQQQKRHIALFAANSLSSVQHSQKLTSSLAYFNSQGYIYMTAGRRTAEFVKCKSQPNR
jgi:hypothetical protein